MHAASAEHIKRSPPFARRLWLVLPTPVCLSQTRPQSNEPRQLPSAPNMFRIALHAGGTSRWKYFNHVTLWRVTAHPKWLLSSAGSLERCVPVFLLDSPFVM